MTVRILVGDALTQLATLPDESVHCCVTSPPYWGLRAYGGDPGMIGLEPTFDEHLENLVAVFREVRRVLRKDGTLWLNYGDRYRSVGTNRLDAIHRLLKGAVVFRRRRPTIRISSKSSNIASHDDGAPQGKLLSLLGLKGVAVKQRNDHFCQITHCLGAPAYCRVDAASARLSVDSSYLQVLVDSLDDTRVVISEHDADEHPVFVISPTLSGEQTDTSFPVEKSGQPMPEGWIDGESVRDSISLDPASKGSLNVYLVDESVPLGNRLFALPGGLRDLAVAQAGQEKFALSMGGFRVELASASVTHDVLLSRNGGFTPLDLLYAEADRLASEERPKQLLGMPDRVRRALQRDGWICRSEIIWHKPNPMPESTTDRPSCAHEKMFLFAKAPRYFYDHVAVRTPNMPSTTLRYANPAPFGDRSKLGAVRPGRGPDAGLNKTARSGSTEANLRNVWKIATHPYKDAHFATFPPALVEPCIKAGTSEKGVCAECGAPWVRETEKTLKTTPRNPTFAQHGTKHVAGQDSAGSNRHRDGHMPGLVNHFTTTGWRPSCECDAGDPIPAVCLDPFAGSGTVGLVADRLGRDAILIEINEGYAELARARIADDAPLLAEATR